jgi:hypothetical protein
MQDSDYLTKKEIQKRARRNAERGIAIANDPAQAANVERKILTVQMPFATGDRGEVRLVISNNGQTTARPVVEVGNAELFELGPTPRRWTHVPRLLVRGIQRNVFTTSLLLPLIAAGVLLLAPAKRKRELMLLLAVPVYYLCVQSAFHTEYRYIIAVHYFLFVLAAVTLYLAGQLVWGVARRMPVVMRRTSEL